MTRQTFFSSNAWKALKAIQGKVQSERLDILTGYIGSGATRALKDLRVVSRIVIGLGSQNQAMSQAQIDEIRELGSLAEVRWHPGLHAKVYLFEESAVAVGSANFTSGGFEKLREALVISESRTVVASARKYFNEIWKRAKKVDPGKLTPLNAGSGGAEGGSIGYATLGRQTPFSAGGGGKRKVASAQRGGKGSGPRIRLCAYWPKWLEELEAWPRLDEWSTGTTTMPGDLQLFCITRDGDGAADYDDDDPRLDAVHSLWRATSYPKRYKRARWKVQAAFELVCRFQNPIPKSALLDAKLLNWRFPLSPNGVYIRDASRIAKVLSARNPAQRTLLQRTLLGVGGATRKSRRTSP